jgi:hypothetical protein
MRSAHNNKNFHDDKSPPVKKVININISDEWGVSPFPKARAHGMISTFLRLQLGKNSQRYCWQLHMAG